MLSKDHLEKLKERLQDVFSDYSEHAGGKNYRYTHLTACHKIARKLLSEDEIQQLDIDPVVVEVAALLHDIGRAEYIDDGQLNPFEEDESHDKDGAKIVDQYINDTVSDKQLKTIKTVIRNHHGQPETEEGKIVQDIDALTNMGTNNLWRMIHYAAQNNKEITHLDQYFWDDGMRDYLDTLESMYFRVTRLWAKKRLVRQQKAVLEMEDELEANDL